MSALRGAECVPCVPVRRGRRLAASAAAQWPPASTPVHGVSLIDRPTGAAAYRHQRRSGASRRSGKVEDCQDIRNNATAANMLPARVLPTPRKHAVREGAPHTPH